MSLLRACLFSAPVLLCGFAVGTAQTLPSGLTRQGNVVMMQPIPDGSTNGVAGPHPSRLRALTAPEHDLFSRAFQAADRGDWIGARALAAQGQNVGARRLLEWRYAMDRNSGATFAEIDAVMRDTPAAWPLRGTLQARAEAAIPADMEAAALIAWFGGRTPNSSIGKIRLGEALVASGERTRGAALIRQGWVDGSFEPDIELAIVQKDGAMITPEADRARLDNLLWAGQVTAAKRMLARVDQPSADLANARMALYTGYAKAQAALDKVSSSSDSGLLFDWSRALRMAGRDAEARAMLLRVPAAPLVRARAQRWWNESNLQARDAFKDGDPRTALALVQHAGFTAGDQHAEQQFLAGFIQLRMLKEPATALESFRKLEAGVRRPISKSRAFYWQGRAQEALGDTTAALAAWRKGAAYPETFYGQLSLARADASPTLRLGDTITEAASPSEVEAATLTEEIKLLADLGQSATLRSFVNQQVAANPAPRFQKRVMMNLNDWGYPDIAVRLAKALGYDGTMMPQFSYPVIPLPAYPGPGAAPEPALVLGLIRQETEFDAFAISGAGARGLMQMMPASAKVAAKQAGLPYRPDALLTDTAYNMQLGMTEYRGHLDRYGGSLVLAMASYNAGPNNAKRWLAAYGDPRVAGTDPLDWIEQIPFAETRNYVQRVLENVQVYRARLAGKEVPLRVVNDLYAPLPPPASALAAK